MRPLVAPLTVNPTVHVNTAAAAAAAAAMTAAADAASIAAAAAAAAAEITPKTPSAASETPTKRLPSTMAPTPVQAVCLPGRHHRVRQRDPPSPRATVRSPERPDVLASPAAPMLPRCSLRKRVLGARAVQVARVAPVTRVSRMARGPVARVRASRDNSDGSEGCGRPVAPGSGPCSIRCVVEGRCRREGEGTGGEGRGGAHGVCVGCCTLCSEEYIEAARTQTTK